MSDERRPLVVYHGQGCRDGFTAAWVAWKVFGEQAEYLPVDAGAPMPDDAVFAARPVFVFDVFFSREEVARLGALASGLVIRDHHKSAYVEMKKGPIDLPRTADVAVTLWKSGGRLAWEYFHPGETPPALVLYTEDRDLWSWKLPHGREFSAALELEPFDFVAWDTYVSPNAESFLAGNLANGSARFYDRGRAVLDHNRALVDAICLQAFAVEVGGHGVLAVNTATHHSEVAERLAEGRAFGCTFHELADGRIRWSLRSRKPGGVDVSEVAGLYGGGGHEAAAGFTVSKERSPGRKP